MKRLLIVVFLLITVNSLNAQNDKVKVMNFNQFEPLLHKENDTLYIINFWATWCKPCVEELPYFEKIHSKYKNTKMKVLLVSLDFKDELESRLLPFIKKRKIKSAIILLDESNPNTYIDKVSTNWSGAIPVTYIYKNQKAFFYEKSFTYDELEAIIKLNLK